MSLTPDGAAVTAAWVAAGLVGAELIVSDGEQSASVPASISTDGPTVVLTGSFGELEANFEWTRRAVLHGGVEFDAEEIDLGRKALGAVWSLQVPIEVL